MASLRLDTFAMPSAEVGPESPLAPLRPYHNLSSVGQVSGTSLPYRTQDGYTRHRQMREHRVAILESDRLRAMFLLDLGGRMWSLIHKPSGRELLERNPVFQPANLAIRNAWFSGGVEWNVSMLGHSVFTCSPVFAGRVETSDGPALRLWEYERSRGVPFSIDFVAPDGSDFLFVSPRISNPHGEPIDMYWWSNIAVPETEGTRVLAPADDALSHAYDGEGVHGIADLSVHPDLCYPSNYRHSADMYFRIPEGRRPWEAAIEADGAGLLHSSSPRLFGRKLFVWGMDRGGRKWQEYLSEPGKAYIEIQGGLARTQGEYAHMPAKTTWSWLEAYGPLSVTHQDDWHAAWTEVDRESERLLPLEAFAKREADMVAVAARPVSQTLNMASGWGALEDLRRAKTGEEALPGQSFPSESMGEEQAPWRHVLEHGELPYRSPRDDPGALMVQDEWLAKVRTGIERGCGDHWLCWYHIGVAEQARGNSEAAEAAFERSIEREPSAWAYRNLAVLADIRGERQHAADLLCHAVHLRPDVPKLAQEACSVMVVAKRFADLATMVGQLPESVRELPRVRLAQAWAALDTGDLETAAAFFEQPFEVVDLREGEVSVTDLWFDVQARALANRDGHGVDDTYRERARRESPPPAAFDFRMHIE